MPTRSKACLEAFLKEWRERFGVTDERNICGFAGATAALTLLASFRAEFEYLIADTEAVARSLVTRALIHLQRSIVADDAIRQRWSNAFKDGETACEALGACHLLAHGIWAFKTSAEGERTDLASARPVTRDHRRSQERFARTRSH